MAQDVMPTIQAWFMVSDPISRSGIVTRRLQPITSLGAIAASERDLRAVIRAGGLSSVDLPT